MRQKRLHSCHGRNSQWIFKKRAAYKNCRKRENHHRQPTKTNGIFSFISRTYIAHCIVILQKIQFPPLGWPPSRSSVESIRLLCFQARGGNASERASEVALRGRNYGSALVVVAGQQLGMQRTRAQMSPDIVLRCTATKQWITENPSRAWEGDAARAISIDDVVLHLLFSLTPLKSLGAQCHHRSRPSVRSPSHLRFPVLPLRRLPSCMATL